MIVCLCSLLMREIVANFPQSQPPCRFQLHHLLLFKLRFKHYLISLNFTLYKTFIFLFKVVRMGLLSGYDGVLTVYI